MPDVGERAGGRVLGSAPNLARLYAKAAVGAVVGGRRHAGEQVLPDTEVVLPDVTVDRAHLAAYDRVCGFALTDRLPAPYLHALAFPLAVELMTGPGFPVPLPGLVHVANRITQHRPVDAGETLRFSVRAQDLRPHERGRQFDVVADATVDGQTVWRGVSTYLRRGGGGGKPRADREERDAGDVSARWRVGADVGRRYAAVSGDRNPIHLSPLTARLFGFRRPIAHGMWTKARCLAALEGRLPRRFSVSVRFAAPLQLPSTVAFSSARAGGRWVFAVRRERDAKPHLHGELEPVS